jgi:hypothetical protein
MDLTHATKAVIEFEHSMGKVSKVLADEDVAPEMIRCDCLRQDGIRCPRAADGEDGLCSICRKGHGIGWPWTLR